MSDGGESRDGVGARGEGMGGSVVVSLRGLRGLQGLSGRGVSSKVWGCVCEDT